MCSDSKRQREHNELLVSDQCAQTVNISKLHLQTTMPISYADRQSKISLLHYNWFSKCHRLGEGGFEKDSRGE